MQVPPLILTKLISPSPAPTFMRRASFIKRIKLSSQVKLTLLHSGAGYGKSSNLSSYFHDTRSIHSYSWSSVTEEDDDILPFLKYLTASIQQVIPTFGQSIDWRGLSTFPKEKELKRWIALFVNELCVIDEPLSVVIDDFHHVDHVFHINYVLEKIIEFMPASIHFIIATRTLLRWPSLLKLKLAGQICEITEEDFIFSEEEVAVFFEDYFNHLLTGEEAANIVQLTEGWAIAINLLAIHMTDSEKPFTTAMKPALYDLFSYLSEEVYTNMSEEERAWLLSFSIFPVFSIQLIHDFYGEPAVEALQSLAGRHIFIQSLGDDGTYRYHALFQQFLERKWQSQPPSLPMDRP